jgi:hypothetical protein
MRTLSRRQLEDLSHADLVRHAERLQGELQHVRANTAQAADDNSQTYAGMRERLGEANRAAREAELKASREVSFFWRVISKIGEALSVDMPVTPGATNEEDWRSYAKAVQHHVCEGRHETLPA